MKFDASACLFWVLVSLFFGGNVLEETVADNVVIQPNVEDGSIRRNFQITEDMVSVVVQSVIKSLKPVVIKSVHDELIHFSYTSKRDAEEVLTKLSTWDEKVTAEMHALRSDIQAVLTETDSVDLKEDGQCNVTPSNCYEVQEQGSDTSGIYTVTVSEEKMQVYCDLETDTGGWTVIQRRDDIKPHIDFYRNWEDYKKGFGDLTGEFWLGLDNIHALTSSTPVRLRVDLEDWEGGKAYAEYDTFLVGSEEDQYRLFVLGYDEGVGGAGDSLMEHHSGKAFTTKDRDNDIYSGNCAYFKKGAWWYSKCGDSDLNGRYFRGIASAPVGGVEWYTWKKKKYSLKRVEMKIKPNGKH